MIDDAGLNEVGNTGEGHQPHSDLFVAVEVLRAAQGDVADNGGVTKIGLDGGVGCNGADHLGVVADITGLLK